MTDPVAVPAPVPAADLTLADRIALLSGSDFWRTQPLPEVGVPAIVMSDGPHGLRYQVGAADHLGLASSVPATCIPTAVTLASTWDEELVAEVGRAVATEARALGVDVVLGPGLNIKRHPLCGRNFEYLSEDPLLSGRLAASLVEGLQSQGVGACLKHYAVNNQESHRFVVDAVVDERTLREIYLAGFEHAVRQSRPWTVMASYNLVNGVPATDHHLLLTRILREEWGFEGLVMSDWAATNDRVEAVRAGLDLEMPGSEGLFDGEVAAAVAGDRLPERAVTTSAQRVLDLVAKAPRTGGGGTLPVEEHDALARRLAAEGTMLLANDGVLPLQGSPVVALIGAFAESPRYQGNGSSLVTPTRVTTTLDALAARGVEVRYAAGYDPVRSEPDQALVDEAVAAAAGADVAVVMVGLPPVRESEGFDRDDLTLPEQHDRLVAAVAAAHPRTVVALSNGAPVLMPWRDDVAAIVESYLGGQASGGALVDVLFGDVEPGGRLAETFPARQADVAADRWFPGQPRQVEYREGLFVGYRHATTAGVEPLFPFGHGLGYTTFEWTGLALDRTAVAAGEDLTVRVTVHNTGERAGSDVVQVYLHDRTGVVLRPRRELAGFAKVRLAPGESAEVTVTVPARSFAFWDTSAADWRIPSGQYAVELARSSAHVVDVVSVEVHGGVDSAPEPADASPIASDDAVFARRLGRPVPTPKPVRPFDRHTLVEELATTRLGRVVRGLLWKAGGVNEIEGDEAARLMFERGMDELPLRAAAIFSDGRLRLPTLDVLLDLLNGRPAGAAGRVARLAGGTLGGTLGRAARRLPRRPPL